MPARYRFRADAAGPSRATLSAGWNASVRGIPLVHERVPLIRSGAAKVTVLGTPLWWRADDGRCARYTI